MTATLQQWFECNNEYKNLSPCNSYTMDSPPMYEGIYPGIQELKAKYKKYDYITDSGPGDVADLNSSEISLDLQNLISDPNQIARLQEAGFLSDFLVDGKRPPVDQTHQLSPNTDFESYSMPQQGNLGSDRYGAEAGYSVKQEPGDHLSCQKNYPNNIYGYQNATNPNVQVLGGYMPEASRPIGTGLQPNGVLKTTTNIAKHSKCKKSIDKSSDEYRRRRERNNIAVRKSREKAKLRSLDTERKVSQLSRENENLKKRIDILNKQVHLLKTLLSNYGVSPESVDTELAKNHHHYGL